MEKRKPYYLKVFIRLKEHTRETFLYIFNSILNKNRNRPKNSLYLNYWASWTSYLFVFACMQTVWKQATTPDKSNCFNLCPGNILHLLFGCGGANWEALAAQVFFSRSPHVLYSGPWQEPIGHLCSQTWPARSAHYRCQSSFVDFLLVAT